MKIVYFNHRPACGLLQEDIEAAFINAKKLTVSDLSALPTNVVLKTDLSALLLQYGKDFLYVKVKVWLLKNWIE